MSRPMPARIHQPASAATDGRPRRPAFDHDAFDHDAFDHDVAATVQAAAGGERAAWDRLVDWFAPTVWAVARSHRLNAADAADVSQSTWMKLIENLGRLQQPDRVGAWLATTARRESLRVLRLAGRQIPTGEDLETGADQDPAAGFDRYLIAQQRNQVMGRLMAQLPDRQRAVLRLVTSDPPRSYRDIGEELDMPIGSIGPTRERALTRLRRLARDSGVELEDLVIR